MLGHALAAIREPWGARSTAANLTLISAYIEPKIDWLDGVIGALNDTAAKMEKGENV